MQPKIFITGATGFVGAHAALEFLRHGYHVVGGYRNTSSIQKARQLFGYYPDGPDFFEKVEWIAVDLYDIQSIKDAFKNIDFVLHAAAEVSFDGRLKNQLIHNNTLITSNVVDAALEAGIKKLCHVSSIAALGSTSNGTSVNEEVKFSSVKDQSGYSISKFYSEMEVWRGINQGLNCVIVNPSVILGAGDWSSSSSAIISNVAKGLRFYTQGITGYVDVIDVAKACRLLLESDISGERFILNSENISYQQLLGCIAEALGKPKPSIKVLPWMLRLAAIMASIVSFFTRKAPTLTYSIARTAWKKNYFDGSKFSKQFNISYSSIDDCIRFTCQCYQNEQKS